MGSSTPPAPRPGRPSAGRSVAPFDDEGAAAFLASIVESSDDAILGKTLDGTILSWNRGAERLYGYTAEEVIGRKVSLLIPPGRKDELPEIMAKIRAGGRIENYDTERRCKDGSIRQISLTVSPIRDGAGRVVAASAIGRDVTRRRAFEEDRERLVAELRAASRARRDFLANMSHELRTPLNAIIGYAELLHDGLPAAIPPEADAQVARIETNARHLLQLIDEVLLFARMDSQGIELSREDVPVAPLLREVRAIVEPLVRDKGLGFRFDVAGVPERMVTDPVRLRQVLVNLLANAVKFTETGEVALTATREDDHAVFQVRDTGVGIDPADRDQLFEPFWQARPTTSANVQGTGLGLTIARRIVDGLGGWIGVEGAPGEGSRFTVRLPLDGGPVGRG